MSRTDFISSQHFAPSRRYAFRALVFIVLIGLTSSVFPQHRRRRPVADSIAKEILIRIVRAEDERRWDDGLRRLLSDPQPHLRKRAALAAGRIGDAAAVPDLIALLRGDRARSVRIMAAFALGEIEAASGADQLLTTLKTSEDEVLRARAIEALGKIAASLPKEQEVRSRELGNAILEALRLEGNRRSAPDELTVLLALTGVLRAKPENAGRIVGQFARYNSPRIGADAANTLARLKLNDQNDFLRKLLTSDPDAIVRANAARVLGATEDKHSYEQLLDRALKDEDARVRVSAIRALASLKDPRAAGPLRERAAPLVANNLTRKNASSATGLNRNPLVSELLEIATALGVVQRDSGNQDSVNWLQNIRRTAGPAPEIEIAMARIHPDAFLKELDKRTVQESMLLDWRRSSSLAQGLGEIASKPEAPATQGMRTQAENLLRAMLDYRNSGLTINTLVAVHTEYAVPDVLRAFAAFKTRDLAEVLRRHLKESDVIIRGTAADLLGELPTNLTNIEALRDALGVALKDKDLNDAALSIVDALGKQKNRNANLAIMPALDSEDHLIRRKAVAVLRSTGAGDFTARIGNVKTRNTTADYERAIGRIGKTVQAVVSTGKGSFTIDLLPEAAPLNVDNFIQLAKRGFFNGVTFHRVVPNFVVQGGDPRGDGNGGPGYSVRCEINEVPYQRGAVGMALSGKDTGGSQWFVTHAPQPHLDGGYTVFGRVSAGMSVVDNLVRGDAIHSVAISERRGRVGVRGE